MANFLTGTRLVLVIPVAYLIVVGSSAAVWVFLFAAATDLFDGLVARGSGNVTSIGKVLDPLADRLLVSGAFAALYFSDAGVPLWPLLALLVRDLGVLAGSAFMRARGAEIEVSMAGKVATAVLFFALVLFLLRAPGALVVFYPGVALYLFTALAYLGQGLRGRPQPEIERGLR